MSGKHRNAYENKLHGCCKTLGRCFAQKSGFAVDNAFPRASAVTGNDRLAGSHGFKWHNPKMLIDRRVQQRKASRK